MTDRIHIDRLSSDDLDALYARVKQAEQLLRRVAQLADVTHRFHDCLGVNLTCASCELHQHIRVALDNQEPK